MTGRALQPYWPPVSCGIGCEVWDAAIALCASASLLAGLPGQVLACMRLTSESLRASCLGVRASASWGAGGQGLQPSPLAWPVPESRRDFNLCGARTENMVIPPNIVAVSGCGVATPLFFSRLWRPMAYGLEDRCLANWCNNQR